MNLYTVNLHVLCFTHFVCKKSNQRKNKAKIAFLKVCNSKKLPVKALRLQKPPSIFKKFSGFPINYIVVLKKTFIHGFFVLGIGDDNLWAKKIKFQLLRVSWMN